MAFYVCPTLTQAAIQLLLAHGSEAQKRLYIPNLAAGRWTASMGLTEPQAGSDLSLVTTKAVEQTDGSFRISGSKIFTSYGEHDWSDNIINLVLARMEGAPAGTRGISLFIVPKQLEDGRPNDVSCAGIEHQLGLRASPTWTLAYGAGGGAPGYLLGPATAGPPKIFVLMTKARLACALPAVGLSDRALPQDRP